MTTESFDPDLKIGITLPTFKTSGKTPSFIDALIRSASKLAMEVAMRL